jgi:ubiquitin carboxyl-terminal hydrolase 7
LTEKRLEEEAAFREARKKERDEQHLYLPVKVITEDTFRAYGGCDLAAFESYEDDPALPRSYRILRKSTMKELAERVAQDTEADANRIRFWCLSNRQNKTTRPDAPITEPSYTVEEVLHRFGGGKASGLRLWCEIAEQLTPEGQPIWPTGTLTNGQSTPKNDQILLFLKHFDVEAQKLSGVGHVYIHKDKKVEDLVPLILKKMNWPEKNERGELTRLRLYEVSEELKFSPFQTCSDTLQEIKPAMIESMKGKQTLKAAELQDGDIICFQTADSKGSDLKSSEAVQE